MADEALITAAQNAVIAINNLSRMINTVHSGIYATSSAVADLPAATEATGAIRMVTDANATTRLSVVAGGGANIVLVYSDGTNWLIV